MSLPILEPVASSRAAGWIRRVRPAAILFLLSLLAAVGLAIAMATDRAIDLLAGASTPATPASGAIPVQLMRAAPTIAQGMLPPHGVRGACPGCHTIRPAPPSPSVAPLPAATIAPAPAAFVPAAATPAAALEIGAAVALPAPAPIGVEPQEATWQGLGVVPLTPALGRALALPSTARGVAVDEVRGSAASAGLRPGDLVIAIAGTPTPDLRAFLAAAAAVATRSQASLLALRAGTELTVSLDAAPGSLGAAEAKSAPTITRSSRPPHGKIGECARCHTFR